MNAGDAGSEDERPLIEASAWRVHLAETGAESTSEFEAWLLADPRNAEAWRRVEASWDFLGQHAAEPEVLAARSTALGTTPRFGRPPPKTAMPWRTIAAGALLSLGAIGGGLYWWMQPVDYQTALGERRTLMLEDGSRLTLDSGSDVQVSYSGDKRDLVLLRGQARFEVAHDASRPFLVTAANATVRATGTDFDVDLAVTGLVVTLIEGRVAVSDERDRVALKAGEQLTLAPGRAPAIASVDVADALAWQTGQIVFHNTALADVIARLNRYNRVQFVLADPGLASLRVSGAFSAGDAVGVSDLLSHYLRIHADYSDPGRIAFRR
jgi:transmembrane sensor